MQRSAEKNTSGQASGIRMLHLIMLGAGVLVALVFHLMTRLRGPILIPDSATPVMAYAFAGIAMTAVAFAVLLLRPRIPERGSSEAVNDYWSNGAVRQRALIMWVVCENAAIIAGLGYLLTGHLAALITAGLALVALAWFGPSRIAGES